MGMRIRGVHLVALLGTDEAYLRAEGLRLSDLKGVMPVSGVFDIRPGPVEIELGGSGMVHPNVLREVGYDPDVYSGWAFGFGVERLGLIRYEIDDIRRYINSDPDFLRQLA